jgi:SulP family sulfate permease
VDGWQGIGKWEYEEMVKQFAADLRREFAGYNGNRLTKDLMAGITVTAVALPLALAFGVSSGADAAAGLITAILAGIVIGLLSGASYQISGPTGAMAAILVTTVAKYGMQGVFLATLLAGVILILAGLFKVGRVVSVIPMPVITGFTSGIAIIIALGQVDNFFGTASAGENAIAKLLSYGELGFQPDVRCVIFAVLVMVVMIVWPKRWQAVLPSSLAGIILILILNLILKWDVPVVGEIPRTLLPEVRLSLGEIRFETLGGVAVPAVSIAVLGMIESLLCGASAGRMKGEVLNADRELVAQGVGNVLLPFFGGVPATAAIARTSVAIKAGQQTRLTSVFHSIGLLLSMFLLSGVMSRIPMSALAGVLMMTAWRMNDWQSMKFLVRHRLKGATAAFLVTMAATVVFDLSVAILAGLAFSCLKFVVKSMGNLEVTISQVDPLRLRQHSPEQGEHYRDVRIIYISGDIFFGSVSALTAALDAVEPQVSGVILSVRGVASVDTSGIHALLEFCAKQRERGVCVCFSGVQKNVRTMMERGGLVEELGEDHFFWSAEDALELVVKPEFV